MSRHLAVRDLDYVQPGQQPVRAFGKGDVVHPALLASAGGWVSDEDVEQVDGEPPAEPEPLKAPAKNAATEEWQKYAVQRGYTEAEAGELSRDELVERLG